MEERILISNQEICNQIDETLIKNGLKKKSIFDNVKGYTKEELELVTTIYLGCSDSLDDLLYLPNLKVLKIKSANQETVIEEDPFSMNHISDFSILSYLTNLEELTIVNDATIENLVLNSLQKLTKLKICNNKKLVNIVGLDRLKNLNNILIYGNKKEPQIDPIRYLENTKDAKKNYLDITVFHDMVKRMNNDGKSFEDIYLNYTDNYKTNLQFVEKVGIYNYYVPLTPSAMLRLYKKAKNIVNSFGFKMRLSTKDKIKALYLFARKKVKYDYEALDNRDTNSLVEARNNKRLSYNLSLPNTSYSALVAGKTVCEGYANMLRFLYYMNDIESEVIYCSSPDEFINGLNHAALKVKYHDQYFYQDADPNWGSNDEEFFMATKEEFEKTHILSSLEKGSDNSDAKRYIK